MKIFRAIWAYLKDWRNWVTHTIIGLLILAVAFYLPVDPVYRIIILVLVISFNTWRMRFTKKKKDDGVT